MFNPDAMRKRFAELGQAREVIEAQATPLRAKRDELIAAHHREMRILNDEIRRVEAGLFDIDMERGIIVRALNGKTGPA